jgi:hypothetical protein
MEDLAMANFHEDLAEKAGMESDQAHQGIGALLAMLKGRLDPAAFAHVQNAIPNSDEMLAGFEDKKQWASGGLMDAVKDIAGKMLGGEQDPGAAIKGHFESIGLTPDHLKSMLPHLHDMLASKLPPQVLEQIKQHVPGFGEAVKEEIQQER